MNNPADTLAYRLSLVRDALKPIPWANSANGGPSMHETVQEAMDALASLKGEAEGKHKVFPINVMGGPMREYAPGKWENAVWPSDTTPPATQAVIEQAARYGWQHASWDWEAVKGGLDRFNLTPSPGPQRNEYHWGWLINGIPFAGAGCSDKTAIPLFARPDEAGADNWQ